PGDGGRGDRPGRPRAARLDADGHRRARRHAVDSLGGARRAPPGGREGARHDPRPDDRLPERSPDRVSRPIGLAATAHYLPERWLSAAEIGVAAGIPESVVVEKFGLRGKHIAAADEHVSDLSVTAASRL